MKRIYLIILLCLTMLTTASAQKLTVESMNVAGNDISASQYPRSDINGNACALVKVRLAAQGAAFSGNVLGDVVNHEGEYWAYMSQGSYHLQVRHPDYVALDVNFRDYGIRGVEGKVTYVLTLLKPSAQNGGLSESTETSTMKEFQIDFEPSKAQVKINSTVFPSQGGKVRTILPVGRYMCTISAEGYETYQQIFSVREASSNQLQVRLERLSNREDADNLYRRAHQYLLDNNEKQAESYAQKAISLGSEKGERIIRALELRGYYENK